MDVILPELIQPWIDVARGVGRRSRRRSFEVEEKRNVIAMCDARRCYV
jgi:hypothetical protein